MHHITQADRPDHERLACVIFDLDGTLTQTNELIYASFNHIARKYLGKTLTQQEIIGLFGPPEEGGLRSLVGEERAAAALDDLCEYYQTNHNALASLHHGIEDVLRYLKSRGVRIALFTGKGKRTTDITLREFRIDHYFDLVVSGSDVVHHKPHHEGIDRVLQTFSLRPSEVLMVGDALSDLKASRGAGVWMASVVWDSYDRERVMQAGSDYLFTEVKEMYAWFRQHIN